jgi:hypothetical protein
MGIVVKSSVAKLEPQRFDGAGAVTWHGSGSNSMKNVFLNL